MKQVSESEGTVREDPAWMSRPWFAALMPPRWKRVAVVAAVAITVPLLAQQSRVYRDGNSWVEEVTGALPTTRELRISTDAGNVRVQGNAPQVTYVVRKRSYAPTEEAARRQFEQFRFNAVRTGEVDAVEGRLLNKNMNHFGIEIAVQTPKAMDTVKADTGGGSLNISSVSGNVFASTVGGPVSLDDIGGAAKIRTGGGNVEVGKIGGDFILKSAGGDVKALNVGGESKVYTGGGKVFIGSAKAATIQTGGGNIDVQKCMGDLQAETNGGSVSLGDVAGAVTVESGGGGVNLAGAQGRVRVATGGGSVQLYGLAQGAQVETGAGNIMAEFISSKSGFSESSLHTAAGDVTVYLPPTLSLTVRASSDMASNRPIKSDFPEVQIHQDAGYGPKSAWAEGSINGGGPLLRVRTTIGQIDLRKSH